MIVAAHQPHYIPWLGYLDKLAKADVFVVMDDLQFEAQNFQNRQRLKLADGPAWLTVPVQRGSQTDRILDKRIVPSCGSRHDWRHRHWHTITTHYGRAPYFNRYADDLHEVYAREWDTLLDLDLHMLQLARKWFEIDTPVMRSSSLALEGAKTDRLIDMCKKLGARCYLTGSGGSASYLDAERMGRSGIGVVWQEFVHPTYQQRYSRFGFSSHLGFLDLLLNEGPASRELLFGTSHPLHMHILKQPVERLWEAA
jgi:hypothetical protein